ncbi:DUF302 domain-containing protein [Halomonas sp. KAO]|uniref:DUF302 domain-containing protein n=1 Tax=unclassified Halomonas TaxID=2609666 RepID=UPI00189CE7CB|nr:MULTISPECIES: DUF302 domain-containing protein [unclassified Halomonas]MBF7053032.1 DUF302 domain-containing protein [Halomonas sp. KAO]MDT0500668.1 DUF302 domain-containing protein [Halomonas sp. PAR7]MDT0513141.1 DUF302 domain-containing protein [Halomonas sp. LES1]MDT0591448.1 DUF302 domain-containing protein [Halomonas sp. PAR8]
MRKCLIGAAMTMLVAMPVIVQAQEHGVMHLQSSDGIESVEQRLRGALEEKGLTLMTVVDHAANAEGVGLTLPATRTFIFGNPKVGTPMMQCRGSMALDLPQKIVVREVDEGVRLEWNSPLYLAERHSLEECDLPLDKVAGVLESVASAAADR